jgi:multidrug efflux system outer membrane protein
MSRDSAPRWLAAVLLVVGGLGGCTVGPNYTRPDVVVPAAWRHDPEQHASIANLGWWQLFEDPTLHELLAAAMVANRDVQVAVARVLESRAPLGVARAAQFPQLSAGASYANERPYSANSFFLRGFPGNISAPTGTSI